MIKFICIFNNLLYLSFQLKKYLWNYFSTGFWSIFPYQVKVSRQKAYVKRKHGLSCNKKGEQEHIQRFLHKMRFWKFHVLVVQNNGKKMYKKVCCKWKVVCLPPNRPFFFLFFTVLVVFTVFRNQFSITIKVILPLSDRYQIFTTDWWLWIEVYQNLVLSKIDINMAKINKKLEIYKAEFYAI